MSLTQWRTSFNGVIGLDYTAIYKIAESLGIALDAINLRKIRMLESETLKMMSNKEYKKEKKCSNKEICAMCTKICDARIN